MRHLLSRLPTPESLDIFASDEHRETFPFGETMEATLRLNKCIPLNIKYASGGRTQWLGIATINRPRCIHFLFRTLHTMRVILGHSMP